MSAENSLSSKVFALASEIAASSHPNAAPDRELVEKTLDLDSLRSRGAGRFDAGSETIVYSVNLLHEVVNVFDTSGYATVIFPHESRQYSVTAGIYEGPISGIDANLGSQHPHVHNSIKVYPRRGPRVA